MIIHFLGGSTRPIHTLLARFQKEAYMSDDIDVLEITAGNLQSQDWMKQSARPLSTIDLDPDLLSSIVKDAEIFFNPSSRRFYMSTGHLYCKGYLLYGPPGTGKTSMCMALATHLDLKVVKINMDGMDDKDLQEAFNLDTDCANVTRRPQGTTNEYQSGHRDSWAPENSSFDLDIYGSGLGRQPQKPKTPKVVMLSGLLNIIDGVSAPTDRLLIMTANGPSSLDKALRRPGRVDRDFEIGYATKLTAEMTFKWVYGQDELRSYTLQAIDRMAKAFHDQFPAQSHITTAQMEDYCIALRDQPAEAVKRFVQWLHRIKPGEDGFTYDINDAEVDGPDSEVNVSDPYDAGLLDLVSEDYVVPPEEINQSSPEEEDEVPPPWLDIPLFAI
ncbi:P-loop containing nucleoside triphosphate hydrolase protein [Bimuria novae-zelandiae CBS 107.79]|uniref:P-loop containing nucleoside triphosphate hydrolase protein n=1 Tax=Bimuria novae-zelandiae CBS 107.79 TaxID=1447943 RepID=A0A6A5VQH2_9PLEO|nr:P-loop containing nucleoside triphosphate hydrolase protein [Bimuria novae-zelandiae CBS 107.79]